MTKPYEKILLAVELNPNSDKYLIEKAKEIIKECEGKVTAVHVIEHLVGFGATYGVSIDTEIEEILLKRAKDEMKLLTAKLGIDEKDGLVIFGSAKEVILDKAKKTGCDLIMVGSHGVHGLRWLLGSTANAVLHGAECDVLAVRLKN